MNHYKVFDLCQFFKRLVFERYTLASSGYKVLPDFNQEMRKFKQFLIENGREKFQRFV